MSAANSAASQVRRTAEPTQSAAPRAAMRASPAAGFAFVDSGDEIRINLGDIQFARESMEIEAFKPSLLSRFLDLVAPLK
jgi:hypothetical protein